MASKEKLAYLVGIALGDGNLSNPNGRAIRLRISCFSNHSRIHKEIIETIQCLLPQNRVSIIQRHGRCIDISVYSNKLDAWMPWTVGAGSKIKQQAHVPDWIMLHQRFARACVRGLIQTDGCIYNDRGYIMVNFTNNIEILVRDVQTIIENMGFKPNFSKVKNEKNFKYTVRVSRDAQKFITALNLYKE